VAKYGLESPISAALSADGKRIAVCRWNGGIFTSADGGQVIACVDGGNLFIGRPDGLEPKPTKQ
jgi:hypothetical protein